jgi:nucleoside-diphosphate-sugar epimerase
MTVTILVTGGSGFIGSHLIDTLMARGERVRALVRKTSNVSHLREIGTELVVGDLRKPDFVDQSMEECDVVFHIAAAPDTAPEKVAHSTNYLGTRNMLEAALKRRVQRFIHCSSVAVLGFADMSPLDEDSAYSPSPYSPYSKTKCEAEKSALDYYRKGLPVTVVRLAQVYGPRDVGTMGLAFKQLQKGFFPLMGGGRALLQPIYVQDVVDAMILAEETEKALGQVYNIAGDEIMSFEHLFSMIADILGVDPPRRKLSRRISWILGYLLELKSRIFGGNVLFTRYRVQCATRNMIYDISKARKELGFNPKVGIEEGVRRTAEWYQQTSLESDSDVVIELKKHKPLRTPKHRR